MGLGGHPYTDGYERQWEEYMARDDQETQIEWAHDMLRCLRQALVQVDRALEMMDSDPRAPDWDNDSFEWLDLRSLGRLWDLELEGIHDRLAKALGEPHYRWKRGQSGG